MAEITIYTKPWCGYCWRAKRLLDAKGLDYTEIDVTDDATAEAEMINRSGRTTAPQIFVDGEHLGDSDHIMMLERDGKLDSILGVEMSGADGGE